MPAFKRFLVFGALAASLPAFAHEPGQIIVRIGATAVAPHDKSDNLALDNQSLSLSGGHSGLSVNSNVQLGAAIAYQVDKQFSVELLAATPFHHVVSGTGELQGLDIAKVRHLPPTLSLIYHFPETANLQPYVGAGINYTTFFKQELTAAGAAALDGLGLHNGRVDADNSWGLALQVGADYHLTPSLLLNASVRWIDIKTKVTLSFANGSQLSTKLDVDPFVYSLGLGLVF
ncbi:MAG: outer membrane beta-barrel protein [Pseudomonadales bacterium]|jgi:outer membrane protein|nr:outer membrane beta-barrel protein [Pseudomonadales bacterium]